jgi:serine/threonine-protein kinase RsbW
MNVEFTVRLPPDTSSVPLIRGLVRQALEHLGIPTPSIDETVLALTEACANVVQHAGEHDEYQVDVHIDDSMCRISVTDAGGGFDSAATAADEERSPLEDGRGLLLMRALVDRLDFVQSDDGRHRVVLEKELSPQPHLRLLSSS